MDFAGGGMNVGRDAGVGPGLMAWYVTSTTLRCRVVIVGLVRIGRHTHTYIL